MVCLCWSLCSSSLSHLWVYTFERFFSYNTSKNLGL